MAYSIYNFFCFVIHWVIFDIRPANSLKTHGLCSVEIVFLITEVKFEHPSRLPLRAI